MIKNQDSVEERNEIVSGLRVDRRVSNSSIWVNELFMNTFRDEIHF